MLFFNSDSGAGVTARIEDDGSLSALANLPPGPGSRWTHIGSDGRNLVFFDRSSHRGTAAAMDEQGIVHPLPILPTALLGDWTNIAANNGWFVLYNARTGAAVTGFVEIAADGLLRLRRPFHLPPGTTYTDVLPVGWSHDDDRIRDRRFLFFNRVNGSGITYRVDDSGQVTVLTKTEGLPAPFIEGWTHIAAHNNEGSGRLYLFHDNTRSGTTAQVEPDGTLRRLKQNVGNFQHCTHIADGSRLLCYNRAGGQATTVEIGEDGSLHRLRELGPIGDFSHIVR